MIALPVLNGSVMAAGVRMRRRAVLGLLLAACLSALAAGVEPAEDPHRLWMSLKQGGYVIFMRHAITDPGIGDPEHFTLGDCSTQRNLSDQGRADAMRIGAAFRHYEVPVAGVWASRWCRCMETAQLAFGSVRPAAMLDSTFTAAEATRQRRVREVLSFVAGAQEDDRNLVFVTHQINIYQLTGVSPASGGMVVTRLEAGSRFRVIGQLPVPAE